MGFRALFTIIFICLPTAIHAAPVRSQAVGLSTFIAFVRTQGIRNTGQLSDLYGGWHNLLQRAAPSTIEFKESDKGYRYLYSLKWGWLDLQHFTGAARTTWWAKKAIGRNGGYLVLNRGEENERNQEKAGLWSAWDYEDLVSNLLGVCFEEYLGSLSWSDNRDFASKLEFFLAAHGYVQHPESAPNWNKMREIEDQDDATENHGYEPMFTTKNRHTLFNETDHSVEAYLERYLKSQ